MKKIICALIFCCFALIATAQKFDVRKIEFGTNDDRELKIHNRDSILRKRYDTSHPYRCSVSGKYAVKKKLFDQAVTPQMKEIFKQEYAKLGEKKWWLYVEVAFEKTTGKVIDATFILPADLLEAVTEENIKKMYRRLLRTTIDTTGVSYQRELPGYPHTRQKIAKIELHGFLKFALEEK